MKATELLQNQHREIENLLDQNQEERGGAEPERDPRRLVGHARRPHDDRGRDIFTRPFRDAAPMLVDEALEEHGLADYELARLLSTRMANEAFAAKVDVLGQVVLSPYQREETELFPQAEASSARISSTTWASASRTASSPSVRRTPASSSSVPSSRTCPRWPTARPARRPWRKREAPKKKPGRGATAAPKRVTARRETAHPLGTKRRTSPGRKPQRRRAFTVCQRRLEVKGRKLSDSTFEPIPALSALRSLIPLALRPASSSSLVALRPSRWSHKGRRRGPSGRHRDELAHAARR